VIVPFTEIPDGAGSGPRPLLDVAVGDMDDFRHPCLVDSGAANTLLPRWLADVAAIDLERAERRSLAVATVGTQADLVTARLTAGGHTWEAEVGFCEPWPYSWGLLGIRSFFRYFVVTFRAADFQFELEPVTV
jgi:hypothetical protein